MPVWSIGTYANSSTPPCIRTLDNFSVYKRTNATWWSQPFYTSVGGYKLQLNVDANGDKSSAGTHLSLYVYLMKGEHDDKLRFPFNNKVKIQLLNWYCDSNHMEMTAPHYTTPLENRVQVINGDRARRGWGTSQFISHAELLDCNNVSIQFIDSDRVCFRIICV